MLVQVLSLKLCDLGQAAPHLWASASGLVNGRRGLFPALEPWFVSMEDEQHLQLPLLPGGLPHGELALGAEQFLEAQAHPALGPRVPPAAGGGPEGVNVASASRDRLTQSPPSSVLLPFVLRDLLSSRR